MGAFFITIIRIKKTKKPKVNQGIHFHLFFIRILYPAVYLKGALFLLETWLKMVKYTTVFFNQNFFTITNNQKFKLYTQYTCITKKFYNL